MKNLFFLLIIFLCFYSCQEEYDTDPKLSKLRYYPAKVGKYITFKYDSTIYLENGLVQLNKSGFIKEEITELLQAAPGDTTYRLIKYWREKETDKWTLTDIETINFTKNAVIKTEENLKFRILVYPVDLNLSWKGNNLFKDDVKTKFFSEDMAIYSNWNYKIDRINFSQEIKGSKLDNLISVMEVNTATTVAKRYSNVIYHPQIGPVRKIMEIYDSKAVVQPGENWKEKPILGYNLVYTLHDHN